MENRDFQRLNPLAKFEIENFNSDHLVHLLAWLKARDLNSDIAKNIPSIGFTIFESHRPVAIGFLRQAEGGVGICEGLCTNPNIEPSIRNEACDLMVENLINAGKEIKVRTIIAWTRDKNTLERSLRHGFVKNSSTLIVYDLSKTESLH